ncbi:DUF5107 domain-containing protein [Streptosporangium sp. NPDC000396]|uniref:DUF5107 domain-containing protein n=1 Tax=Streptosporangium sp. NPDC000396 TaxID=3366185 RepID=UPI0036C56DAC
MADPGPVSPLPILRPPPVRAAYGVPFSLLPYGRRDGYGRHPVEREIPSIVLENKHLRAEFLPSLGGRLWSLVDKSAGRELLFRNPVIQPANLALRDAWFAGGVEWNLGTTGHWPLTCEPLHAVRVGEGIRMYEYERMRGLILQIDARLAADVLLVGITLRNPQPHEVPVYWWSNIAIPETPATRVLVPASKADHYGYAQELTTIPFTQDDSVPARWRTAADYFFHVEGQPWIAAVDESGYGLLHVSTDRLSGRKLFGWGSSGPGGAHWQDWLSEPGSRYLEIQAGLARTQFEHLPMPAGATWTWTEAYGPCEPSRTAAVLPDHAEEWADLPAGEVLHQGSGWGALDRHAGGIPELAATPFPDTTLGPEQRPWLGLLATGRLPGEASCVVGPGWLRLLEDAEDRHGLYHLGLNRWASGDPAGAVRAWERSLDRHRDPLTLRAVAEASRIHGDDAAAAVLLLEAHALAPGLHPLTVETLTTLIAADRPGDALNLIDSLRSPDHGRIRLLEAQAALKAGDRDRAGRLLEGHLTVPDLREGEDSLDELWFAYHGADAELPAAYDFRMS